MFVSSTSKDGLENLRRVHHPPRHLGTVSLILFDYFVKDGRTKQSIYNDLFLDSFEP